MKSDGLLLVDIQNDFLPGGSLAVPHGDDVVPVANRLASRFERVFATQDWHPADHASFAAHYPGKSVGDQIDLDGIPQILWPVHCVQETAGADFAPGLKREAIQSVVRKGVDSRIDSYSGFFDNGRRRRTELEDLLRRAGVRRLFVMGLATDFCVKFTACDAAELGFETIVVADGCRAVELTAGDEERAFDAMRPMGIEICTSEEAAAT